MDTLFFLLSKIAWALLSPITLILLLLIMGGLLWQSFRWQTLGKTLFLTGSLSAIALIAYPIGDFVIQPLEKRFPIQTEHSLPQHIDGIIILGGGEKLAHSLSWQSPQIGEGGDRYIAVKYLSQRYPQAPIIFSGGSGNPFLQQGLKEGWIAKTLFQQLNIAPQRWIIESQSRNTYENFKNLKPLLPKSEGRYLLITSAFHMPRAVGIARAQNIQVIPYPTDFLSLHPQYRHFDFNTYHHLQALQAGVREWIGLLVYFLTGKTLQLFPSPEAP